MYITLTPIFFSSHYEISDNLRYFLLRTHSYIPSSRRQKYLLSKIRTYVYTGGFNTKVFQTSVIIHNHKFFRNSFNQNFMKILLLFLISCTLLTTKIICYTCGIGIANMVRNYSYFFLNKYSLHVYTTALL